MQEESQMLLKGFFIPGYATLTQAPQKTERFGLHWEIVIGIGKDHLAFLTMDDEALKALQAGEKINIKVK